MNINREQLDWEPDDGVDVDKASTDLSQFDVVLVSEPDDDWISLFSRRQPTCQRVRTRLQGALEAALETDGFANCFIHFGLHPEAVESLFEDVLAEHAGEYLKIVGPYYITTAEDRDSYAQNCLRWVLAGLANESASPLRVGVIGAVLPDNVILLANLAKSYLGDRAARITILSRLCL